ncbi:MAG: cell envelope integrity protein TolA [Emcibacteraceae bacterium]|nr:cell envelope integrity protein TolA [Emcibacteraceae bacterium]
MAALLNKIPEKLSITERLAERFGPKEQKATSLDVQRQTMSIKAAFRLKIEGECWNPPSGALDAGKLIVVVNFNLSQDGRIIGQPRADDYARMSGPLKVAADSALRAVRMCAPYSDLKLPKDMYDQWKEIKLTFDPSDMLS